MRVKGSNSLVFVDENVYRRFLGRVSLYEYCYFLPHPSLPLLHRVEVNMDDWIKEGYYYKKN